MLKLDIKMWRCLLDNYIRDKFDTELMSSGSFFLRITEKIIGILPNSFIGLKLQTIS